MQTVYIDWRIIPHTTVVRKSYVYYFPMLSAEEEDLRIHREVCREGADPL